MSDAILNTLSEHELDTLVSIAIRRAEVLSDQDSLAAIDAWREVALYERRLAQIAPAADIVGGVARVGAVSAALEAGDRAQAAELASQYLAEPSLPSERRQAIKKALDESKRVLAKRFPSLAKKGRLAELDDWKVCIRKSPRVFPLAA
jgi:hypothetical protein